MSHSSSFWKNNGIKSNLKLSMLLQYFTICPVLDIQEESSSEKNLFAKNIASQIFNYYVDAHFSYHSLRKQHNEMFHSPLGAAAKMLAIH